MKIRLFVDAHVFDGSPQGTLTYIRGLYGSLVRDERFEITLAARNLDRLKAHFPESGFRFHRLKSKSSLVRLFIEIPLLLIRGKYHFAHFQYVLPLYCRCKTITTTHDLLFLDFPEFFPVRYRMARKFLFRLAVKRSDLICTVSEYSRERIGSLFGIHANDIFLTPNGVSLPVSPQPMEGLPSQFLLYVSRFEPRKNHLALLRAHVELDLFRSGVGIVFVGRRIDVPYPEFEAYYAGLPAEFRESIVFFEDLSDANLSYLYQTAVAFVYPSFAEGFGIPPLEAAMHGCKVLCSNRTAMGDFDFFGEWRFDPSDFSAMKAKLSALLDTREYPTKRIISEVRKRYDWRVISSSFAGRLVENLS